MITSFFRNQILPALKIFSNENFCAWRETRAHTNGAYKILHPSSFSSKIFAEIFARGAKREHARTGIQNSAPKLLFIEDFCRDFCAWRETRARTNGHTKFCAQAPFHRRFLQRFLRVARNASTHERSVPKRTRPRARAVRQSHTQKDRKNHSHSMVAGGFEVISYTTRFACFTSFTIRVEIFSRTS